MRLAIIIIATLVLTSGCKSSSTEKTSPDFLAKNVDTTVNPADDFFDYALGNWLKNTPIPEAESSWGIANLVQEEIYTRLRKINEDASREKSASGVQQKIGDFWYSGMDTLSIEQQGLKPLAVDLDKINRMQTITDIVDVTADLHIKGIGVLFTDYVAQDDKNSDVYAFQMMQGGLGMPNRDYYFNNDERTAGVRKAYAEYLVKTFMQLGNDSIVALANAKSVMALETEMAKNSRKLADLRDPYRNYNKMAVNALGQLSPNFAWTNYLAKTRISKLDSVIVGQPEFYKALNSLLTTTPLDVWKNYLRFHLVRASAPYLDTRSFNNFFVYRKSLTGTSQPRPRWKRVLDAEEQAIGEALGQIFVKEYFNETAKKRYSDLVENIRDAYRERIEKLTWMSDSTKQKAYRKLSGIKKKVGYPDKWKDFSALKIDRGPFILNVQRAQEWWHNYEVSKLGKPVNRDEWEMTPQTWNAYYNPSNNEIVLPAGIFAVPGMKDEDLDDAFVYGYAGASTIGHEITHGFDDQGRQYDEKGNLTDWWLPADAEQFKSRAKRIINQFNAYVPVDTLHINGEATQGENIADLGGVLLGLDAFKKTAAYKNNEQIGGFTPLQRYFLGYSYSWMFKERKERLANQVMTDVHSPAKQRVNGAVVNVPEFYQAFNVKPGSKMYQADSVRVNIW
ncbi:M13 family peptidase [Segetibacter sp. 3557_3]|uniref:M13 family metallopeptidase n=1 Tax=Segetibacter sp. 3557_3 TaxID=2547429 RepID=UPI001058EE12|nr:M13 family metallopeptidase [Segetibacter sp. 3557_3]TDH20029.1 M13 family peptidase [Segetibacter sp. 3557_3]